MAKTTQTLDDDLAELDALIAARRPDALKPSENKALLSMERLEKFKAAVRNKESTPHRVAVDFGGGVAAQVSTELINYGVRALGRWSKDGFWAHNVDLLQGVPHFVLGLGVYFAEMITRDEPKDSRGAWVSTSREVLSEAAKIFAQLGFANLSRAIRVRWSDSKKQGVAYQALVEEKAQLETKLAALQAQQQTPPAGKAQAST